MKLSLALLGTLVLTASAQAVTLRSLQGGSFVDLNRQESEVELNVVEHTQGHVGWRCGLELRSNQPFPSTEGFNTLKDALKVELRTAGPGFVEVPASSLQNLTMTYTYTSESAYGSVLKISTKSGQPLGHAIEDAFSKSHQEEAPRVVVTAVACTPAPPTHHR